MLRIGKYTIRRATYPAMESTREKGIAGLACWEITGSRRLNGLRIGEIFKRTNTLLEAKAWISAKAERKGD